MGIAEGRHTANIGLQPNATWPEVSGAKQCALSLAVGNRASMENRVSQTANPELQEREAERHRCELWRNVGKLEVPPTPRVPPTTNGHTIRGKEEGLVEATRSRTVETTLQEHQPWRRKGDFRRTSETASPVPNFLSDPSLDQWLLTFLVQ